MDPKKRSSLVVIVLVLFAFASTACIVQNMVSEFLFDDADQEVPTPVMFPTPECGGDVTGTWTGTAIGTNGTIDYNMSLVQNGCSISGSQTSRTGDGRLSSSTVTGTVENGIFSFTEVGSQEGVCYWIGALTILPPGDSLVGNVTNCSQPAISLTRK